MSNEPIDNTYNAEDIQSVESVLDHIRMPSPARISLSVIGCSKYEMFSTGVVVNVETGNEIALDQRTRCVRIGTDNGGKVAFPPRRILHTYFRIGPWHEIHDSEKFVLSCIGSENGEYGVTHSGDVYNLIFGDKLSLCSRDDGYMCTTFSYGTRRAQWFIHRLVAIAFIPPVPGRDFVNHMDGNKSNNHYTNLEWCTAEENNRHARIEGLSRQSLTEEQVRYICERYASGIRIMDIANELDKDRQLIYGVTSKQHYRYISDKYDFSGCYRQNRSVINNNNINHDGRENESA